MLNNGSPVSSNTTIATLLSHAQSEINNLYPGEEFLVKELFSGYEWNRIPKGYRTKLGGMFFVFAQGSGSALLDILGKTQQNQQRYRRK